MDQYHVAVLVRTLTSIPSRRDIVRGLVGAVLGLAAVRAPDAAEAEKKRKKKNKHKKRKHQENKNPNQIPPVGTPLPPPVNPPRPVCTPTCAATNPCGPDGCGGSCGTCRGNETCQNGTCLCVPQCAPTNACGSDGCNGSCGTCAGPTCQGTTLTTQVCDGGTCTPVTTACNTGQVCFQNACCTKRPRPSCHKQPVSDGCGGTYPPNCGQQQHCCDGPNGDLVCRSLPCP